MRDSGRARGDYGEYPGERAGRFSQTAEDLRNRLGMRGSVLNRDRNDGARNGSDRTRPSANGNGNGTRNGYSGANGNGSRNGTAVRNGNGHANGNGYPGRNGAGDRGYADRSGRGSGTNFWSDPADGRTGRPTGAYRGARRAGNQTTANGSRRGAYYDDYGRGTERTALRDRTGRWISERTDSWRAARENWAGGGRGTRSGRGSANGWNGRSAAPLTLGGRLKEWFLSGRWWKHWTWKKALGVAGALVVVVFLAMVGVFIELYRMTPIPTEAQLTANWSSSSVYFANGDEMGIFDNGGIERQLLTSNQIPTVMTDAMTAAEDRHFYTEGGVSITGLARAALSDIFGSGNLQGGSTITMQYAKNYYSGVNTGRNISTKLKEIFIATKLGHERSKQWVMTSYLNTVPFGTTIYGLGAAAESYFDVNLTNPGAKLTVAQAAMLAAMPNAPGFYSPVPTAGAGYTQLVARWHYVLTNMVRDGNITQAEANAQKFPAYTPPPGGNGETGYTGYLMNMVEQQLEAPKADGGYGLTQHQIDTGGYRITTTFNMQKVRALARTVNQAKAEMRSMGLPFREYDRIGAVLEDSKTGAIIAVYGGPGYGAPNCAATDCDLNMAEAAEPVGSSFKPYVLATAVNEGMNVFTSKLNGYSPIWIPILPSDTATQLQLSSLTPPKGLSVKTGSGYSGSTYYYLFNESGEDSNAPLPVNTAAAISSDPAFEDLAHRDGINNVIAMAKAFGVGQTSFVNPCEASDNLANASVAQTIADCNDLTGPEVNNVTPGNGLIGNFSTTGAASKAAIHAGTPGSPQIALGQNPLTPIEQASTFATLADDGVYHTPHVIAALSKGNVNYPLNVVTRQVLTPQQAADVDWALSFDNQMTDGTAFGSVPFRRGDVIGKTGTLGAGQVASQAWFIGATPDQYAMSVALFTNNPGSQNLDNLPDLPGAPGSQGGAWPATIWNNYMTSQYNNMKYISLTNFPQDKGAPFQTWIQAKAPAPKLPTCKPFQFTNCTPAKGPTNCNGLGHGFGNGNGNCPTASTSASCNPVFEQCAADSSPSPSVTPSPSVSVTFTPGTGAATTASVSATEIQPADEPTTAAELTAVKQNALAKTAVT